MVHQSEENQPVPICPQCGSENVIPIIYGMPDEDLVLRDAQGEAKIGGVAEYPDSPTWHCQACGHEWRPDSLNEHPQSGMSREEVDQLRAQIDRPDS
ncbi:MAG: hypothetical protein EA401_08505 [Planctomycetota bacterium]|nr:MAG: hypothetical protein EA401_08505 [Planctomycetota bacterium]